MVVLLAGILYPQGVHAKLKKGIYFSGLTGKRKDLYSDINIKKLSMKANRLIVYGKFQYSKSMKNFWAGKRVNLKYKKTVFPLKKKCKMISSGGEGRPDKLTKKSFLKLAKLYNGLGLSIVVDKNGKVTKLPRKNVDTGMGYERVVAVLENKDDNYTTSVWKDIISKIEEISKLTYEGNEKSMRIIADHIRTAVFISADPAGIKPSNTDQGYILRRLIRRAIRHAKKINIINCEDILRLNLCKDKS